MSLTRKIDNPEQAHDAIKTLRSEPPKAQIRFLKQSIQAVELNQMYFEQKGNEKGASRMEQCLALLRKRLNEIEVE